MILLVAVVTFGVALATPANAADGAASYVVDGSIEADGSLVIKATITPEGSPGTFVQRFATKQRTTQGSDYVFTIEGVKATAGGADVGATVRPDGDYQVVTVPAQGATPIVLEYTVRGAAMRTADNTTTVSWRALQGLNQPVRTFEATLSIPGPFTFIDCAAGAPASPGACAWYAGGTDEDPNPVFHDGPRGAGEVVQLVVRFGSDVVAPNDVLVERWSLDRAFSVAPVPLGLAGALAALGALGLWAAHRKLGTDAASDVAPLMVGSFRPVGPGQSEFTLGDDVRPAEVGTLVDQHVDPIDVTAAVLDLAVRNHLLITELPRATQFAATEWSFTRRESAAALLGYEALLLDAVAPPTGEARTLSDVGPALSAALPGIQAGLYDEVVRKGWFGVRPDATRGRWNRVGWISLAIATAVALALVAFTPFGLAGLVLVALAAAIGLIGNEMPARTPKGSATLAGLGVLRGALATQPTDEMPQGREHQELAQVLPYAIVLGGADRWLAGLVAAADPEVPDPTELSWYHGPQGWSLTDLPDSLRNFIRALEGTLVAR